MRILVVDDNRTSAMLTATIAEDHGADVETANSGERALEMLEQESFDLVLMDVVMPGLDGYQTTREIRKRFADRWFPILFLTGRDDDDDFERGIDAGGDDYMIKPISEPILMAKIKAMARILDMQNKLVEMGEKLAKAASTDALTGLLNRRAFSEYLNKQWLNNRRNHATCNLSVLMMDIDHFKPYNDNYGHMRGDEVIKTVAEILDREVNRPLDAVARYGGEEYIAVLPDTDLIGARVIGERVRAAVEAAAIPHIKSSTGPVVTVSVGVSSCAEFNKATMEDLIDCADGALYKSKERGRNQVSAENLVEPFKIMVVDDEQSTRDYIRKIIEPMGEVILVNSGTECLELAGVKRPDLILLDVVMPDIDGYEVCRQLKQSDNSSFVPVVFVTAAEKSKVLEKAKQFGANGVLQKPIDQQTLEKKIKSFLS